MHRVFARASRPPAKNQQPSRVDVIVQRASRPRARSRRLTSRANERAFGRLCVKSRIRLERHARLRTAFHRARARAISRDAQSQSHRSRRRRRRGIVSAGACVRASSLRSTDVVSSQGLVTNDVSTARPGGDAAYGASLTPKGKIILDVFAHREDDDGGGDGSPCFLLDVDRDRAEEVRRVVASSRRVAFSSLTNFSIFSILYTVYSKFTQDESA